MLGLAHFMGTELGDWEALLIVLSVSHSPLGRGEETEVPGSLGALSSEQCLL